MYFVLPCRQGKLSARTYPCTNMVFKTIFRSTVVVEVVLVFQKEILDFSTRLLLHL